MKEKMKAAVVEEEGEIQVKEVDIPEPEPDEVRIEVKASSVCHSDIYTVENLMPFIELPRIPGHEVVGVVEKVGERVENWSEGEHAGVGWHGGHCMTCKECQTGNPLQCRNAEITGVSRDGGHAEYMTARKEALAEVPEDIESEDAAPLMCAGVTTFNALRHTDARPGDTVAIVGIGGLGHLGIQYASNSGYTTVAVSHSPEKENYAKDLGADRFIDSSSQNPGEELQKIGGADVVLCTAPVAESIEQVIGGLTTNGEVSIVGVPHEEIDVSAQDLVMNKAKVSGWSSGHAHDSQDTMEFSAQEEILPEIETFSLEEYPEAYQKMMDGDISFRAVLTL